MMSSMAVISYQRARPLAVCLQRSSSERCFSSAAPNKSNNQSEQWWSLSSLHKRVATIMATTLPDSSRSDLHESLSKSLNNEDSHKSHSINEAIVSARARDVSVQKPNAEKQKQIEKEIEQRALKTAQERMELELLAMKEQLKRKEEERMSLEKEQLRKEEIERQREESFTKWQENVAKEQQQEKEEMNDVQTVETQQSDHPILGPQIAHLSYKRIHLTSASKLASLPVYEKQRAYRHDRAKEMAKDKKKTLWMGIPGVISLMEEECGRLSILDGQHRVGMMALLSEEQRKIAEKNQDPNEQSKNALLQLDLENVLVEVFMPQQKNTNADAVLGDSKKQTLEEQDDKAIIFTEINKAEPIKLLDLPGVTNKRTRDVIDYAANHFYNAFPEMFSPSQKCRAPHLNLDNLRDALFASEVMKREKISSGGELVKWMTKKNEELREVFTANVIDSGKKVSENALKKARKHDFFLGLESTWLYK